MFEFTPTYAGAGIALPSFTIFACVFYIMGHGGWYVDGLSELCHVCVTYM